MTPEEVRNRGYNLMLAAFVFIAGLAFGTVGFNEIHLDDKVDDLILLGIGVVTLLVYLFAGQKNKRTLVFPGLVVLAALAQLYGVFIENSDKEAFGDNIGGMFVYFPLTILAIWQYLRPYRIDSGG